MKFLHPCVWFSYIYFTKVWKERNGKCLLWGYWLCIVSQNHSIHIVVEEGFLVLDHMDVPLSPVSEGRCCWGGSSFSEVTNPHYSTSHKGKKARDFQLWDLSAFGTVIQIFGKLYLLFPLSLNEVVFSSDHPFWVCRGSVCLWDALQHAREALWALCGSCAASPAALFWRWEPIRARGKVP